MGPPHPLRDCAGAQGHHGIEEARHDPGRST